MNISKVDFDTSQVAIVDSHGYNVYIDTCLAGGLSSKLDQFFINGSMFGSTYNNI